MSLPDNVGSVYWLLQCFRPHIWGCPFRTILQGWCNTAGRVSVPISGDVPSGQVEKELQLARKFPSPYLGMSLPDKKLKKPSQKKRFRPHIWGCPFRTIATCCPEDQEEFPSPYLGMSLPDFDLAKNKIRPETVSVPISGDVPSGQNCQQAKWGILSVSVPISGDVPSGL